MADPLSIGDIVHLRSGSPDLTVEAVRKKGVQVAWFVDGHNYEWVYPAEALTIQRAAGKLVQLKRG